MVISPAIVKPTCMVMVSMVVAEEELTLDGDMKMRTMITIDMDESKSLDSGDDVHGGG